ncbi:NADH-quinone oxidoreductase subunit C [bacterium]|nr:NADH-quinone oxidoreductase subunit C [bacterium]MBU1752537.1 NADH-quinone oxidoreductase subunit C [bacterium]
MSKQEIIEAIKAKFTDAIEDVNDTLDLTILVKKENILEICRFLADTPDLGFDYLSDICGVDYSSSARGATSARSATSARGATSQSRFDVVYHIYSINKRHRLRIKAAVEENENISSVESVWKAANWYEREAYDMFGIVFDSHSDLRRILLPEDWKGHPLRKDYSLVSDVGEKWLEEKLVTHVPV